VGSFRLEGFEGLKSHKTYKARAFFESPTGERKLLNEEIRASFSTLFCTRFAVLASTGSGERVVERIASRSQKAEPPASFDLSFLHL